MRQLFLLILISALLFRCPTAFAEDTTTQPAAPTPTSAYYVPPAQLNAQLQVTDLGFAGVFALFRNATASFSFNEGSKSISHLRIALDTTSLMSNNADALRDLINLLSTTADSEIALTAPDSVAFADGKAELKGNLTLRGVNKPVTIEATLNRAGKSPVAGGMWSSEGDAVGLSLKTSFKRADFGLGDNPNAETPGRFGDSINLQMEMQGIKQ